MSGQSIRATQSLSKYPSASLRELAHLSWPIILGLFSASLMGICDRLFLAHYSLDAMKGTVSAANLAMLFQHPVIRIAAMSQVFVGLYYGAEKLHKIGPTIWQMIWLCFFSMLITLPASQFVAPFFFGGTSVQAEATTYFNTMMAVNFFFPLGTALTCYFTGQGRVRIIFLTTLISHGFNIGLDYIFIFGIEGYLPSMGVFGAALATGIAQLTFCVILFCAFLRKKERETYGTSNYHFDWGNFWEQLQVGLPRAIARIIILSSWAAISRIMTLKNGDYLLVLSIGGTLMLFFTFINDGMLQGMITIASNLIGSKNYDRIWKLARSGLIFLMFTTGLLAIPYLVFPIETLSIFAFSPNPESMAILKKSCIWLWVFCFCYGFNAVGLSLVTASRDLTFYLLSIMFVWTTSFLPVYLGMYVFNFTPDKLWLIMAIDSFLYGIIFFVRASKEKWRYAELKSLSN